MCQTKIYFVNKIYYLWLVWNKTGFLIIKIVHMYS